MNEVLKNAEILGGKFRNFSGTEHEYNPAGKRNFCVVLDNEQADKMRKDGWNVKTLNGANYINVKVNYGSTVKPSIYLVKDRHIICRIPEIFIGELDSCNIVHADLSVTELQYDLDEPITIAYLETLYIELEESALHKLFTKITNGTTDDSIESLYLRNLILEMKYGYEEDKPVEVFPNLFLGGSR